ncbi:uncharacterized protein LOC141631231 [Silene latifolia]|uniref:uncharacterized protein LOC141631231 n=1 Tax=Silene latifolia TaxID=37657 RepID=UPI003D773638
MSSYNRKVGSEYLAQKYIEFWRNNTDWKLQKFQKHVLQELGVHVTYMRCWLARSRAKLMIHGNGKDQYAKVWEYALAVLKYNPGSSAFVVCDNIERPPPIFKRFYICLKACKEGFITGCRPILGVNGCHLRGVYPGMCLVAVGIDANNNIFPVAWAVVEVENRESWTWFLELLANDIGRVEGEGLTVMSDRQKGLIDALATVVPKANIRFCARHIWANLKLRFSGQLYKDTFWAATRALTRADFSKEMEGMKFLSRDAWSFLNDIPPRHWSRHAFDYSCKSNLFLNNVCEVFNAVLKDARDKPILTQLEWMRKYVMQRICQKREGAKSYEGRVMPYVKKYLEKAKDESRFAHFMQSDEHEFEVELRGEQVVVNLKERSCGCNYWNITGLPCPHAMACLLEKRMDPKDYVDASYSKERYMLTYANKVSPMPGARHWKPAGMPEPLPPALRTMPGRPKVKKRRKEAGEKEDQQLRRGKRPKTCSNC